MSSRVVSDPYFDSRLVLYTKQCKLKRGISTVCLEKWKFLLTAPNIGNIYVYIYQIEARETLINNLGSIPTKSPPFNQKMTRKPRFYGGTSTEKLWFTGNDGYGWIDLGMLSLKNGGVGWKAHRRWPEMAKIAAARFYHVLLWSCIARRLARRPRASTFSGLSVTMHRRL